MPTTTTGMAEPALYKLLAWFSPAMPVGAYSYSHGLEWAVEAGLVRTAPDLRAYVETVLRYGSGQIDALLLRASYGAGTDGAFQGRSLSEVTALGAAMRGTRELALESAAQGRALLTTLRQTGRRRCSMHSRRFAEIWRSSLPTPASRAWPPPRTVCRSVAPSSPICTPWPPTSPRRGSG
jgi:urease accessory protein UreF